MKAKCVKIFQSNRIKQQNWHTVVRVGNLKKLEEIFVFRNEEAINHGSTKAQEHMYRLHCLLLGLLGFINMINNSISSY